MVSTKTFTTLLSLTFLTFFHTITLTTAKPPDSSSAIDTNANAQQPLGSDNKIDPSTFTFLANATEAGYTCRSTDYHPWETLYGDPPKSISRSELDAAERVFKYLRVNPCECYGFKEPCCPPVLAACPALTLLRYPCVDCGGTWNRTRNCCPILN